MSTPSLQIVVLSTDVTVAELARALEFTGLTVSATFDPCVFKVEPKQRTLPQNVIPFTKPALLRRQAE